MKILIIRLKYIGDSLLALPTLKAIRENQPDAEIHYLLYENCAPLHVGQDYVDDVKIITNEEHENPLLFFKKMRQLRKEKYDVVIDLLTVPTTVLITVFMGAKRTIGFDKGKLRSKFYTHRVKQIPNISSAKQKLSLLKVLPEPIAFPVEVSNVRDLPFFNMRITLNNDEIDEAKKQLIAQGIDLNKPIVCLSCIARQKKKLWPADNYVQLVNKILGDYIQVQVLFLWGPSEREAVAKLAAKVGNPSRVFYQLETKDVKSLACVLHCCDLYVGNDSGPRHIAESAGISTFTIFSPSYEKTPWMLNINNQHQAIGLTDVLNIDYDDFLLAQKEFSAKNEYYFRFITPELVYTKLKPMLEAL